MRVLRQASNDGLWVVGWEWRVIIAGQIFRTVPKILPSGELVFSYGKTNLKTVA